MAPSRALGDGGEACDDVAGGEEDPVFGSAGDQLGEFVPSVANSSMMRRGSSASKSLVDGSPLGPRSSGSWRSRSWKNRAVARTTRLGVVTEVWCRCR